MSDENSDSPYPPTPREVMLPLLSKWADVPEKNLEKYDTEKLRHYFNRASDPAMCRLALGVSSLFAGAAVACYMNGHPVDTAFMVAGAVLDGWGALHHQVEMKKVKAELKANCP